MADRFLITGALGCVGAWATRLLLREGAHVVAVDRGGSDHRLRQLLTPEELARAQRVDCDITDLAALTAVVRDHAVTNVIHLAALQVPFCRADPSLGAEVNVVGTVNVFEAVRAVGGISGPVVFASSVAAYDAHEVQPDGRAGAEPSGRPTTLYGVYKVANEGTARVYAADHGISSVGLRPYVVYGVGRDQGVTSSSTFAMLAAAAGRPYRISYGGTSHQQLAEDVGAAFIAAARSSFVGADVFNLGGSVVDMSEVVAAIEQAVPAAAGQITVGDGALPFPERVDRGRLEAAIGPERHTALTEGVEQTISEFRGLIDRGALDADALLSG